MKIIVKNCSYDSYNTYFISDYENKIFHGYKEINRNAPFIVYCKNGQIEEVISGIVTKKEIVENWLPRYTGKNLEDYGMYILLTNFQSYVDKFAHKFDVPIDGADKNMPSATAEGITIINFGMGSPNAATIMDLLSSVEPKAVLFLGKCGGLKKKSQVGDLILPIAAIRGEGTSNDYFPPEVPALPSFNLQKAIPNRNLA